MRQYDEAKQGVLELNMESLKRQRQYGRSFNKCNVARIHIAGRVQMKPRRMLNIDSSTYKTPDLRRRCMLEQPLVQYVNM